MRPPWPCTRRIPGLRRRANVPRIGPANLQPGYYEREKQAQRGAEQEPQAKYRRNVSCVHGVANDGVGQACFTARACGVTAKERRKYNRDSKTKAAPNAAGPAARTG